ncbi:MAG: ABC transporter ATP-binding protein [Hyphomicrobiales bacterium]
MASQDTSADTHDRTWGKRGTAAATFASRLEFDGVTRAFGDTVAVNDVSFELAPGEIVCLLGPSGCGKTTLLRIAAGIERVNSGRVLLDGQEITSTKSFVPPEKRGIGLMFQDFALFPHLSIFDNVAFGLKTLDKQTVQSEVETALKRVGLERYAKSYPNELSGGEQQRVALARALVPRPSVILMDEPFSGLDQRLRDSVREETLALLKETRSSCLLVTHDPIEAMWLADRIVLMREGRLVQSGTADELYNAPVDSQAARFFSAFNEFLGHVQDGQVVTEIGPLKAPEQYEGQNVRVMLRPQGLQPTDKKTDISGFVSAVRFLGDTNLISVSFQSYEHAVTVQTPASQEVKRGDVLNFETIAEHVLFFPA